MSEKLYAKIFCEEGVVHEEKYETEAQARAFMDGWASARELLRLENEDDPLEFYQACVDDQPSKDDPS